MVRKDPDITVNMCWDLNKERYCRTFQKKEAYALKREVESKGGTVWWWQALN
jgi:hypothetical protein